MSLIQRIKNLFRDPRIVWDKDGRPRGLRGGVYDYDPDEYAEIVAVFKEADEAWVARRSTTDEEGDDG